MSRSLTNASGLGWTSRFNCQDVKGQTPLHYVAQEVIRFQHEIVERKCQQPEPAILPVYLARYALDLDLIALFSLYGASEITSLPQMPLSSGQRMLRCETG